MKLAISLICVAAVAIALSRYFRLSARYERTPKKLSDWSALDKGIDPTQEKP